MTVKRKAFRSADQNKNETGRDNTLRHLASIIDDKMY